MDVEFTVTGMSCGHCGAAALAAVAGAAYSAEPVR
jgi:copper chaperone CopZ